MGRLSLAYIIDLLLGAQLGWGVFGHTISTTTAFASL
jgi:hypothetical protein